MVVLPVAKQHPDIQKLHLNVVKLEEATNEALSSFFADKDAPNNARKRPYLREIFLLARNEEKYLLDEIGMLQQKTTAPLALFLFLTFDSSI